MSPGGLPTGKKFPCSLRENPWFRCLRCSAAFCGHLRFLVAGLSGQLSARRVDQLAQPWELGHEIPPRTARCRVILVAAQARAVDTEASRERRHE